MQFQTIIKHCFVLFTLIITLTAFSNPSSTKQIQNYEKQFNFDWANPATIEPSKVQLRPINDYLQQFIHPTKLNKADRLALGKLSFKMGSYYSHINHDFDFAINKLELSNTLLNDPQDKIWIYNQLSYAYALEYAAYKQSSAKEKAISFLTKASTLARAKHNETALAYAHYVKGLINYETKNYNDAKIELNKSLALYQKPNAQNTVPSAIVRTRLAKTELTENAQDEDAIKTLLEVKQLWLDKPDYRNNPYAANTLQILGDAYLKIKKPTLARDAFLQAMSIYQNVYGEQSNMLINTYEGLGQAYMTLGDQEQADRFQQKAATLACPL